MKKIVLTKIAPYNSRYCIKTVLQLRRRRRTTLTILTNCRSHTRLLVLLTQQATLVKRLLAWRYIQRRVLVEKVDRLHVNLDNLTRHHRKILDPADGQYVSHMHFVKLRLT
jgi:hypothetical protein